MNRLRFFLSRVILAASCATFCLGAAACSQDDELGRIRAWIEEGASRAEKHDLAGLLALTSGSFRAEPGGRDRKEVREILAAAFYHYRRFRILYPEPAVQLSDDRQAATATIHFLIAREERFYPGLEKLFRDPEGWLEQVGENADLYRLVLGLTRTSDSWVASSARLHPLGRPDFGR